MLKQFLIMVTMMMLSVGAIADNKDYALTAGIAPQTQTFERISSNECVSCHKIKVENDADKGVYMQPSGDHRHQNLTTKT